MKSVFSKKDSQIIKGIAISMMLWHHCFLTGRYEEFSVSFFPFLESQIVHIAAFLKFVLAYLHLFLDMECIYLLKIGEQE